MNIQELQTLINYKVPVKTFILNNHIYGITKAFQKKIENYKPETKQPVFTRALVGEKVTATSSFTHSLSTTIGMSCHEPIAKVIAEDLGGFKVEKQ